MLPVSLERQEKTLEAKGVMEESISWNSWKSLGRSNGGYDCQEEIIELLSTFKTVFVF
jgi:hypothetical protein